MLILTSPVHMGDEPNVLISGDLAKPDRLNFEALQFSADR